MDTIPVVMLISRSGWVARLILVLLAFFSLVTWAIIFNRLAFFSSLGRRHKSLRRRYGRLEVITDIEKMDRGLRESMLGRLGTAGAAEYKRIIDDSHGHANVHDWSFFLQTQFHMAGERIESCFNGIVGKLDRGLIILAVASSIAPFLGLLGTVWGIMNSFYEIGNQGNASLPVVAPGIAEALITTIVGLAVAIPAALFYNLLMRRVERVEDEVDEFRGIILSRLKSDIFSLFYRDRGGAQRQSV